MENEIWRSRLLAFELLGFMFCCFSKESHSILRQQKPLITLRCLRHMMLSVTAFYDNIPIPQTRYFKLQYNTAAAAASSPSTSTHSQPTTMTTKTTTTTTTTHCSLFDGPQARIPLTYLVKLIFSIYCEPLHCFKPISQLRFDYDMTTIRRYHDTLHYDGSDQYAICVRFDCDTTTTKNSHVHFLLALNGSRCARYVVVGS